MDGPDDLRRTFPDMVGLPTGLQLERVNRLLKRHTGGKRAKRSRGSRHSESVRRHKSLGRLTLDPIRNPPKPKRKKQKIPRSREAWAAYQTGASFGKTSEPDHPPYRAVALVNSNITSNRAKTADTTSIVTRGPPITPSFKALASVPPRESGGWIAGTEGAIPAVVKTQTIALTGHPDLGFDTSSITQYEEEIKQHKLREAISHGRVHAKIQQQLEHLPLSFLFNYRNDDNYKLYVRNRGLDVMERMYRKLNDGSVRAFFARWQQKVRLYLEQQKALRRKQDTQRQAIEQLAKVLRRILKRRLRQTIARWSKMSRKDRFRQRNKAAIIIQTKVRQQQALALFRLMQRQRHLTAGQVELYLLRAEFMMFVMRRRWHIAKRARDRLWRRKTRLIKRIRATRLLQRTWRGTLGRYRFSVIKARHDAIIRMQTLVRGHIVRAKKIIEKRRKIAAQRRRVEFAASIIINKAARQRLAAKDFLLRRKALLEYYAFLDRIQMTWKRLVRMALIKRRRDVALEELEQDKLVELQKLMKLQKAAAIEFQRIIRGHREHQRIPMMLAERERIKQVRFHATLHIQRRRRREIERRWWRRRFKKMRREMIRRARQAQEVVRPWVKEYPTVTMRKVGDLLDRVAEKICLWEIKKLLLIRREMEEYKRRDMATLKIQCQWRSYKGQQTLKMLQRIALEKRRALEKKMSTRIQTVMRRYMAIFLVENRRLYLLWLNLLERLDKLTNLIPWLDAVEVMMETFPGLKEPSPEEDAEEKTDAPPEQKDSAETNAESKTEPKPESNVKLQPKKAKPKVDVVSWEDEQDEEELAELNMHDAYKHYDEKRRLYMRQALAWGFKYEAETLASLRLQRIWRGAADRFSPIYPLRIQTIHLERRYIDRFERHKARVAAAAFIIVRYPRSFLARRQRRALLGRKVLLALNHERYPQIRQDIKGAQPADWDSAQDVEYVLTKPKHLVTYREIDFMYMVSEFWAEHEVADDASAEIQRIWHGFKGRRRFKRMLAIKLEEERRRRELAVRLIQRVFRGYLGNKRFREKRFQVRTQQALVQYKMQKRTERERKDWHRKLAQDALRQRILREHREQMAEEKLRSELQFKQKKAFYAAQMKVAVASEKQAYATVQVMNAWRQRAEADGRVYYFNDITLEATYDPPPHWRLPTNEPLKVLYWKNLEDVKDNFCQTITEAENALCRHCYKRNARRECHQCVSRYCVECYTKYHSTEETRHHTFGIIEVEEPRVLLCTKCNERDAQVKCVDEDKVFCQPCFEETHTSGLAAKHKYLNFKVGTPICIECDTDFAQWSCRECGDVFCDKCCKAIHAKGKLRTHKLTKLDVFEKDVLVGDEQYCNDCELRKADRICDQCGDWFCANCWDSYHKKGNRSKHTWTPWGRAGVSSGWEEFFDEEKGSYIYFNKKTKESRTTKPPELMWGTERMELVRQQRENIQRAHMEQEIRDLQEQLEQAQVSVKERTEILKTIRADNNSKPKLQQAISNIIGKPEDKKKNRRPRNKKEEKALVMEDTVDGDYTMEKRFHEGILREVKSYREDILARDYRKALVQMDTFEKAQSEMTEDALETALDNVENYFKYDRTTRLLMEARERARLVDLGMKRAEEDEVMLEEEEAESKTDPSKEDLETKTTEASTAP